MVMNYGYYNYMTPQQRVSQYEHQTLRAIPVTSIQEAQAGQVNFDGSLSIFVNEMGGEIYTKRVGKDGLPIFIIYKSEKPIIKKSDNDLEKRIEILEEEFKRLEKYPINKKKEVKDNE